MPDPTFEFQAQVKCMTHAGNEGLLNDIQDLLVGVGDRVNSDPITRVGPYHGEEMCFVQASFKFEEDGTAIFAAVVQAAIARLGIEGSSSIWLKQRGETEDLNQDLRGWGLAAPAA